MYSALDMRVSKEKSFSSQDINLSPLRASEIFLLNRIFYSKIYAAGDYESSVYPSLSQPTVSQTLYGSDLSGQ